MTSYEFALKLNREVTDDEIDALYEAGLDDAGIETGPLGTTADFSREAPSLAEAIASAARDIDKVQDLRAVGVQCDNMVTMLDIARRAGVTREAVRLWVSGKRGPGGFPKPVMVTTGRESVWDWEQVAPWIERRLKNMTPDVAFPANEVEAHMHREELLEEARRELERLKAVRAELERRIAEIHNLAEHTRILSGADRILAARDALRSEPDETVRQEFERLLEDA